MSHTLPLAQLRLTPEQEREVLAILRAAYFFPGGACVFAEIRPEQFPSKDGPTLIVGLVPGKEAKKIQKLLNAPEPTEVPEKKLSPKEGRATLPSP